MLKFFKIFFYTLQIISISIITYILFYIKIIPINYIIVLLIILISISGVEGYYLFSNKQTNKKSIFIIILNILITISLSVSSLYLFKVKTSVDLMTTTSFQKRAISIIVLKDSEIKNEIMLPSHSIGYVSSVNKENMKYTVSELNKKFNDLEFKNYEDFDELTNALYEKKSDMIILDESFRSLLEQVDENFQEKTRVIYQIEKTESAIKTNSVNVTENPFLVYISGNDEYGELSSVSRSDVNMLVAVNPDTKKILLLSIPRDTYYPLNMNKQYDKFTHSGMYGLQESINTLQDIVDEEINYYVRLNFTSFIEIIDSLGGITVDSPNEFITKIGKYKINKGINKLNAKQALGFVRERKSFIDGDFQRGRNQQLMIESIIKKACSPAILTSFSSVLDTITKSIETNMTSSEINSLIEMQLSKMIDWDIKSYQIKGDTGMMPCYSSGRVKASVVIPYEDSINKAHEYIDAIMNGEEINIE